MINCITFFKQDVSWFEIISTTILPVLLFLSGYWLSKLVENKKDKKRLTRLRIYFIQLVKQLNSKLIKQIKEINNAADRQSDFNSRDLMAVRISGESHKLLKAINREELYEVLVLSFPKNIENRAKLFDKILSDIDFINEALGALEINMQNIPIIYESFAKIWDKAYMELNFDINHYKALANQKGVPDKFLDELDKILKSMEKLKGDKDYIENVEIAYKNIIEPINKILKVNSNDSRTPILMDLIQKSKVAYLRMKENRISNKKNYLQTSKSIEKTRKSMINLLNEI